MIKARSKRFVVSILDKIDTYFPITAFIARPAIEMSGLSRALEQTSPLMFTKKPFNVQFGNK